MAAIEKRKFSRISAMAKCKALKNQYDALELDGLFLATEGMRLEWWFIVSNIGLYEDLAELDLRQEIKKEHKRREREDRKRALLPRSAAVTEQSR